jgi:phosphate ABC transporter, permease protein PstC
MIELKDSGVVSPAVSMKRNGRVGNTLFKIAAFTAAALIPIVVITIFVVLFIEAYPAIKAFGVWHFITTKSWDAVNNHFGAFTPLFGSIYVTIWAFIFAAPISIGVAIYITELAPNWLKPIVTTAIELLAAIPTVIYGMWGLFVLAPVMQNHIEPWILDHLATLPVIGFLFNGPGIGIDTFTTAVILSIMITPFMSSLIKDAFGLVPEVIKESAYGLGATRWEVIRKVVMPYVSSGIFGSGIFAIGRALGETMAVSFVNGNNHNPGSFLDMLSLLNSVTTITVTLADEFTEAVGRLYLSSLFYIALILLTISFSTLAVAKIIVWRLERRWRT